MPTWDRTVEIAKDNNPLAMLFNYLFLLSNLRKENVIAYMSAFTAYNTSYVRTSINDNDKQGFMTCVNGLDKNKDLFLILHTPGGSIEAGKSIISYLRNIFKDRKITVAIPHKAMSMGTYFACSADEILMGPYSSLGPVDPQAYIGGNQVSMRAVLKEVQIAESKSAANLNVAYLWAEKIKQIPPGYIALFQNACEHMENDLADTLRSYMFAKDLASNEESVKLQAEAKVQKIAKLLTDLESHSTHGKEINYVYATEMGLNVSDLSRDKILEDLVLSCYHTASILFESTKLEKIIVNNDSRCFTVQG
jgi:ClpP class serine protease